ncbi:hypothetical protein I302_102692 [Kwoniella bestiolae CBS 10118]|uniref:NADH:flavin oxidoreductase/NADH oxidase N-terminal domain-containing protein n=1 Tax=Kwoniella bestiolae CBS 10118 TaxID=1296100 RepID=A0A1B9GFP5_9TREE|nr:hypothetical protein I302_01385 [Kwoniella bestiolae CBS 10118]OCF29872.1 hypothetical protein I302_01385 [Kwoniella bestiolae CBS 10118]
MTINPPEAQQHALFQPISLGGIHLKHRVVMAPMTRLRADDETAVPAQSSITYYEQRATDGGLIITEGVVPSAEGKGWHHSPGIWSKDQIQTWKKIVDAVHAKGGKIVCQLFAAGRVADPTCTSVVYAPSDMNDPTPGAPKPPLKVMTVEDIKRSVSDFVQGAKNCMKAGFDGVELHSANGYLLDQFVQRNSNHRADEYGGSLANRLRFPLEVFTSVAAVIGSEKIGIRISPFSTFQGMRDPHDPLGLYMACIKAVLDALPGLAYIHAVMPRVSGATDQDPDKLGEQDDLDPIRQMCRERKVAFIVAGGFKREEALEFAEKNGDLVAFGRYFTSNPDLVARIKNNWPLVQYNRQLFYTQGTEGYTE